jgi:acetyl/propionyl-CoA carboxylase alpha subunit
MKTLVANRGEIAVRVQKALRGLGWSSVAAYVSGDDSHVETADDAVELPLPGVAGYLDAPAVVAAALTSGCEAVHPGYGFLSESADLARRCAAAGLVFVGPTPETLELFGDKARARDHATALDMPVLAATAAGVTVEGARDFLARHPGGIMIKATAGGGGRGMRVVRDQETLADAYARCRSEALRGFGDDSVFVEALMPRARHIEVQIVGDGTGAVHHLGERDCSLQRRHQKLVEYAPSPSLPPPTREALCRTAVRLMAATDYRSLATVEFLVDADRPERFVFLEVNPRVQVEHTVTEELLGVDLVRSQLRIAAGETLADLRLPDGLPVPEGRYVIQARVNAEQRFGGGEVAPSVGTLTRFEVPAGARVDTHARPGLVLDGTFDPLLAKIVVTAGGGFAQACAELRAVLADTVVTGVETTVPLLREILADPVVVAGRATTAHLGVTGPGSPAAAPPCTTELGADDESPTVRAPLSGVVLELSVAVGDEVPQASPLLLLEAMKMEHVVAAPISAVVQEILVGVGDQVAADAPLVVLKAADVAGEEILDARTSDATALRPDLVDVVERHAATLDAARPEAVVRRHVTGHRTARENLADLCDEGSLVEYGALAVAAQRSRRPVEELIAATPADGIVTGLATVNAARHGRDAARVAVLAYDYTVLAGTQGHFGHRKKDRILGVAARLGLPVVLFAEGGGGRPGDVDTEPLGILGMDTHTFGAMGALSGTVPTVGIVTGRCFGGNAALAGCCDVIIATRDSTVGMAGPAMIEAAGLGRFTPDEVGPMSVQGPNGVVDVVVEDDAEAVSVAKRYLSYFQGALDDWTVADQELLRTAIGENRRRAYDIRALVETLADTGSVLELRAEFARTVVTALVRIEGKAYGLIANDPARLGGAIDSAGADKLARFLQLCDAHGLPLVSLCDTPGFIVGPDAERTATVRHFSRLFVIGAHLRVPLVTIILRKAYGLGANAMAGGHGFQGPVATVAWPTGEIGAMGLEGAVELGFARELQGIADPRERQARYEELLDEQYERGRALSVAGAVEFDDVIDPAETRRWVVAAVGAAPTPARSRTYVDAW